MLLLFLVNIAVRADDPNEPLFADNPNPNQTPVDPIPDCASDIYVQLPCWDFLYTPNNSSIVEVRDELLCLCIPYHNYMNSQNTQKICAVNVLQRQPEGNDHAPK